MKNQRNQIQHEDADDLCAMAINLAALDPDDPRADPAEIKIAKSVGEKLLAREDNALAATVGRAFDTGGSEAGELLLRYVENAATTYTSANGKYVGHLFAVPVILVTELMDDQAGEDAAQAYSDLSDSFQQSGLLQPGAFVCLARYLYSARELARVRWSAAKNLAHGIAAAATGTHVPRDFLFQSDKQPPDSEKDPLSIRYLVGVHISQPGQWAYFHSAADSADERQHEQRIKDWRRAADPLMRRISAGATEQSVHRPHDLFAAFRAGLTSLNDMLVEFFVSDDLRCENTRSTETLAEVAVLDSKHPTMLRISVWSRNNQSLLSETTGSLAPFETAETALQRLGSVLARLGIGEIRLIDQTGGISSSAPGVNTRLLH